MQDSITIEQYISHNATANMNRSNCYLLNNS